MNAAETQSLWSNLDFRSGSEKRTANSEQGKARQKVRLTLDMHDEIKGMGFIQAQKPRVHQAERGAERGERPSVPTESRTQY